MNIFNEYEILKVFNHQKYENPGICLILEIITQQHRRNRKLQIWVEKSSIGCPSTSADIWLAPLFWDFALAPLTSVYTTYMHPVLLSIFSTNKEQFTHILYMYIRVRQTLVHLHTSVALSSTSWLRTAMFHTKIKGEIWRAILLVDHISHINLDWRSDEYPTGLATYGNP